MRIPRVYHTLGEIMQTEILDDLEESLTKEIPCESIHDCNSAAEWLYLLIGGFTFPNGGTKQLLCTEHKEKINQDLIQNYAYSLGSYKFIKL